jgi:hypothetical protein
MFQENHDFGEDRCDNDKNQPSLLAMEAIPSAATPKQFLRRPVRRQKISLFWQVFGGTIVSIVALVITTVYSQMTTTESDLRKDLNRVQVDLVRKDEFNTRLTALWNSIKEQQMTCNSLINLNERAKILVGNVSDQIKTGDEHRKDLQRKIEELTQRLQVLAERLANIEGGYTAAKLLPPVCP